MVARRLLRRVRAQLRGHRGEVDRRGVQIVVGSRVISPTGFCLVSIVGAVGSHARKLNVDDRPRHAIRIDP
ncbi:hypothetical protein FZI93_13220 [Mycobacterium sp. CBMA361]|nr:hypothetical protein [Mycolicibacterium sp. CBMA 361]